MMQQYKNLGGNSGIEAYEIGNDYIKVRFDDSQEYKYTYLSAGEQNVEIMKQLAQAGQGLHAFINTNRQVKYGYER